MDKKIELIIQKQNDLIADFEKQLAADQRQIDTQNKLIVALQEKASLLEKEKQDLIDAGNELSAANEKLERLCVEQQELLESFSRILSEQ